MRRLAGLLVALCLWAPTPVAANPLCRWVGLCLYYSPGFELTVVDGSTGKPLPDVYAWAEWVQYGNHGVGSPLVVQDAFSDADGRLKFPSWGPRRGSRAGLPLGRDPAIILFKPGYTTLVGFNAGGGSNHHAAIRASSHQGQTLALQPFRGSGVEWVDQLRKLVYPALHGYVSDASRDGFKATYLRRVEVVERELAKVPTSVAEVRKLSDSLARSARFYRGEE
jgi:hypothetical protein